MTVTRTAKGLVILHNAIYIYAWVLLFVILHTLSSFELNEFLLENPMTLLYIMITPIQNKDSVWCQIPRMIAAQIATTEVKRPRIRKCTVIITIKSSWYQAIVMWLFHWPSMITWLQWTINSNHWYPLSSCGCHHNP